MTYIALSGGLRPGRFRALRRRKRTLVHELILAATRQVRSNRAGDLGRGKPDPQADEDVRAYRAAWQRRQVRGARSLAARRIRHALAAPYTFATAPNEMAVSFRATSSPIYSPMAVSVRCMGPAASREPAPSSVTATLRPIVDRGSLHPREPHVRCVEDTTLHWVDEPTPVSGET